MIQDGALFKTSSLYICHYLALSSFNTRVPKASRNGGNANEQYTLEQDLNETKRLLPDNGDGEKLNDS